MFKKSALAVVVAASMIPAAAMAETTLYGQARVFFVNEDNGTADSWNLESDASRIGIKGSNELDHGLEVVYKFEYEVNPTDKQDTSMAPLDETAFGVDLNNDGDTTDTAVVLHKDEQIFKRRNQYVGLKGGFGQVIFGRHDTPLKKSQGKIDLFSDYYKADIKNALDPLVEDGENRVDNIVYYKSPNVADAINIHVAFIPGETPAGDDGVADSTSMAVTYKTESLYLAFANDDWANDVTTTRLTGQFNADAFGIGAMVQQSVAANDDEETAYVFSGYFKASDKLKLKLQHVTGKAQLANGADSDETTQSTLGADYKLGKKTTLAGYVTAFEDEAANGATNSEYDIFGLGLIHKF